MNSNHKIKKLRIALEAFWEETKHNLTVHNVEYYLDLAQEKNCADEEKKNRYVEMCLTSAADLIKRSKSEFPEAYDKLLDEFQKVMKL